MSRQTHFVIYESDSLYSITECGRSGLRQAFMSKGVFSGDGGVLKRLSRMKPAHISIQSYVENNAGHLIYLDEKTSDFGEMA